MACSLCGQQPELCGDCSGEDVALIRDSTLALEEFNKLSRETIDDIFTQISVLHSIKTDTNGSSNGSEDHQLTQKVTKPSKFPNECSKDPSKSVQLPQISDATVKLLLQQLLRLEVVNQKLKNYQVSKTHEALEKRMHKMKNHIFMLSEKINVEESKLAKINASIYEKGEIRAKQLQDLQSYEITKLTRVCRQARKLQLLAYNVLTEAFFSTHGRYILKKLYFNRQPIINIEQFLSHNGRLEHLNLFLESLIVYQMRLAQVFEGSVIKMPYIEELARLLPDLKFFEIVRNKEIEMFGDHSNDTDDAVVEEDTEQKDGQHINLGDALKLPLSLKTLNYQRREETRRKSIIDNTTDDELKSPIKTKMKNGQMGRLLGQNSETSPEIQAILRKKMVILPHKILTKPLTKLSSKELLKFLQIIVKILVNFKVFFTNTKPLTELYDFHKILEHSANLRSHLELVIDLPLSLASLSTEVEPQFGPDPLIISPLSSKPSVMNFYSRLLSFNSDGTNDRRRFDKNSKSGGIFGDVSEMGESHEHEFCDKDKTRVTIKKVYDLMVRESHQFREKIEDWQVISKML